MQVASRIAAWQSGKKLPYKRRLAYLESTGKQYINTGIELKGRPRVEAYIQLTELGGALFGAYLASAQRWSPRYVKKGSDVCSFYNNVGTVSDTFHFDATAKKSYWNCGQYAEVDGERKTEIRDIVFSLNVSIYLFGVNYGGTLLAPCKGKMWSAKVYINENLMRRFIPVMDFNDVPCMYDEVSGECFYNQGTGAFLYGELDGGGINV